MLGVRKISLLWLRRTLDWENTKTEVKGICHNVHSLEQGGIFTSKVGRIFQQRIEKSQKILMNNHALSAVCSHNFEKVMIFIQYFCQNESFLATGGISCQRNKFPVKIAYLI